MSKNLKKRVLSLLLAVVTLLGIMSGCGDKGNGVSSGSTAPGGTPVRDKLVIAFDGEPPTLAHQEHNSLVADYMNNLTYAGLFYIDENLTPQKNLCKDYRVENETEWYFELHEGVKFHDGSEMTAEDVVASLERAKTFPQVARSAEQFKTIEAVDTYTVKITTYEPYALMLNDLGTTGNFIIPKHLIESGNDFNQNPIGCGPYKFKEWSLGDHITFERFDDYFDPSGVGNIQTIEARFIPESSARTIALEANEVDFVVNVSPLDIASLDANPDVTVAPTETESLAWLILNNEVPPFDNVNFRKALNAALNREDVVNAALNGAGVPQYAQVVMGFEGSTDEGSDEYDVELAKKYLDESGIDPEAVSFKIICSNDQRRRIAEIIQSQWHEIGIDAEVEMMDMATYLSRSTTGDFETALGSFAQSNLLSFLKCSFHSGSINAINKSRLNDPEIDAMIEEAERTLDEADRLELLEKIGAAVNETATQVPLYREISYRAHNSQLQNVLASPTGSIRFCAMSWPEA